MDRNDDPTNLEQLLDRVAEAAKANEQVSVDDILEFVGPRSFGPLLLFAGLVTLAPVVGDIPGVPAIMGLLVFLIAIQLLFHKRNFWLPGILLNRSVACQTVCKSLEWLYPPARFLDRFLKPRLSALTKKSMVHVVAFICLAISLVMPVMEVIPFSANIAGGALTAFGLSLIARDGYLALLAMAFTASIVGLVVYHLI